MKILYFLVVLISLFASSQSNNDVYSDLSVGEWYRFKINSSGVYKIDATFLSRLGITLSDVQPTTIQIFGSGGQMNSIINTDKIVQGAHENSIVVVGEEDGVFDPQDYILFYGIGHDQWNEENQTHLNLYSDETEYFITFNRAQGKRVRNISSTHEVPEQYTDQATSTIFYEEDNYNIGEMGRRWFGQRFIPSQEETIELGPLTDLVTDQPVLISASGAATSKVPSQLNFLLNDKDFSISFSSISANSKNVAVLGHTSSTTHLTPLSNALNLNLSYTAEGDSGALAFLDYVKISYERFLYGNKGQFIFSGAQENYKINSAQDVYGIWDITESNDISVYLNDKASPDFYVRTDASQRTFLLVDNNDFFTPSRSRKASKVSNQNLLEKLNSVEYIIITNDELLEDAERLANYHQNNYKKINTVAISLDQIYTQFNAGNPDIVSIRDAIRYAYHGSNTLKYVCLFGDTTYDYKNRIPNNNMMVPTYHALSSFSVTNSYMSDDFYAVMETGEGDLGASDDMEIAVGRMLVDDKVSANTSINKVIEFTSKENTGSWRNSVTLLSDDVDDSWETIIQEQLDQLGDELVENNPFINLTKFHSDAFVQEVTAAGNRYPSVSQALKNRIGQGTLVLNYFGHGNEDGLASEFIFDKLFAQSLFHPGRYPLFITSTCEFSRFDNPNRITGGELTYLNPAGGAISLISTTRQIFVTNGINYNKILSKHLFGYDSEDQISMAEALRRSKNEFWDYRQKRIVFYIGDPALDLPIAKPEIKITHLNGFALEELTEDQKLIRALDKVRVSGIVIHQNSATLDDFNGEVTVTLFDKSTMKSTLGNDGHQTMDFQILGPVVFNGNAPVLNGVFDIEFVIPKDISLNEGVARVSMYAYDESSGTELSGFSSDLFIGNINTSAMADNTPPTIELFLDNEEFKNGDAVFDSPLLIAKLYDESGINTSGGLGHDLLAIIDNDTQNPILLNQYYSTHSAGYQQGSLFYNLSHLTLGKHTLLLRAWDTHNNPATKEIEFLVLDNKQVEIIKIFNSPNPMSNQTTFNIIHNKPRELMEVKLVIHDVTGKILWQQHQNILSTNNVSREIQWNGTSSSGETLRKGMYLYTIELISALSNSTTTKSGKIIIN